MSSRTPREDSVVVATGVRKHLATALDGLDVLVEDDDGSITISERRALKMAREGLLAVIRDLNSAPELTGLQTAPA
jgi:lysine/ornithine N-monooxygenase